MNPDDFAWTEDQQITVTNPTSDDFKFKVHNKDYLLEAGRTAKMPGYIAWMYVYGQATKLVQADGKFNRWNEEGFRQQYYDKFIAGVDELVQVIETDEPDVQTFTDEPSLPLGGETYTPEIEETEAPKRGRPAKV